MTQDNRLNKIEKLLTPKQAVVLWLNEIQDYRNPEDYVRYMRGRSEYEATITKLTEQITVTLRQSMRGSSKEFVDRTVRSAVKDVVFLV
jgi:Na+-transporting NADH:ubiquinone oxidoreductase subunit NqrF